MEKLKGQALFNMDLITAKDSFGFADAAMDQARSIGEGISAEQHSAISRLSGSLAVKPPWSLLP